MYRFTHLDQTQHGTLEFPAEYYFVDHLHPRYQMPFHWHKEWELLRVRSGSFSIFLDNRQFTAKAGDILLIRGGILHGGVPSSCVYECFVFDLYGFCRGSEMIKKHLRPFYRQTVHPKSFFPFDPESAVYGIVDRLMSLFTADSAPRSSCYELETVACICQLFAWILEEGCLEDAPSETDPHNDRLDQLKVVLEYIEANYHRSLSLEQLAGIVGMNPKYFCKVFASLTHQSPMDYVNFYRIEQASDLLIGSEQSITSVGMECGFLESSYFTKVFRRYKDMSPREFRTKNSR